MSSDTNPFRRFERQLERMQRQFEEAMNMWDVEGLELPGSSMESDERGIGEIGIDLADRGDELVLTADVPGFETDDIDLTLTDSTLQITAERERETTEEEEGIYVKSERSHRSMRRAVRLPEEVDRDGVTATYNNGVLTVTMPKVHPEDPGTRSIDIE